ncbi:MAG TPA: OmpA family protein [Patescibacteria group bacterium]|nr:OmpA family protein [Patescibacteria group bacterium]
MRRHLLLCTAIAALLSGVSSADAQYLNRYRSTDAPSVEVNLDALNERQEHEYHAATDVQQEALPIAAAEATAPVDAPLVKPVAGEETPVAPAAKRKLAKAFLTAPSEEAVPEPVVAATPAPVANDEPGDGEMPMPEIVVKHVELGASPMQQMTGVPDLSALNSEADRLLEELQPAPAAVTTPPLPKRKPRSALEKPAVVQLASATPAITSDAATGPFGTPADVVPPEVAASAVEAAETKPAIDLDTAPAAPTAATGTGPFGAKEDVAPVATATAAAKSDITDVKKLEPAAGEAIAQTPPAPVTAVENEIPAAKVQLAQAEIPSPVAKSGNRNISQPPQMKEQRLEALAPRGTAGSKPIVSQPPVISAPVAPHRATAPSAPTRPAVPPVPTMSANPVEPVAAAPLEQKAAEPAAAPEAAVAPAADTAQPATPRPSMLPPVYDSVPPRPDAAAPAAPAETGAALPVVPAIEDLTLAFPGNTSDLTAESQRKLDAVAHQMTEAKTGRLHVRGYATGDDGQSSARRISLSRALAVRTYLMEKNIKPNRIDVQAKGSETDRSPTDRVDLIFAP